MYINLQLASKKQNQDLSEIRLDFRLKMKFWIFLSVLSEISGTYLIARPVCASLIISSANYIAKNYSPMSAGDKIKIPSRFINRFVPGGFELTEMHNAIQNFKDKESFITK